MIKTFKHKGLRGLFETGSKKGVNAAHARRLTALLDILDAAEVASDMAVSGSNFHPLKGDMDGFFSVSISGNWRLIFRFTGKDAFDVDYVDYH